MTVDEEDYADGQLQFNTRVEDDKRCEKIYESIASKSSDFNDNNVPHYNDFIKDAKRITLIFYQEQEIIVFIDKLRNIFGQKLNDSKKIESEKMMVQIRELNNGFENGGQNLKIYLDILLEEQSVALTIEVDCNVEELFKFKHIDEVFIEFFNTVEVNSVSMQLKDQ